MAKKLRVAVLMGGKSAEHDISLISGREVLRNLDKKKYDVLPIVVSRDGITWQIGDDKNFQFPISNFQSRKRGVAVVEGFPTARSLTTLTVPVILMGERAVAGRKRLTGPRALNHIDVVFIAMHGPFGEDGTVQGFLELLGIPYTGSGVLASALGMDKLYSRKLFIQAGLTTPDYVVIERNGSESKIWERFKKPPVFIHPHNQGSAVGASLVKTKGQLRKALALAHKYSQIALVDEYVKGTELTCAILGNDKPKALPLVEVVPKMDYFDWQAKYDPKFCDEIVPARISKKLTKKAQEAALIAYKTIGCRAFGRVDMIIKGEKVYVLEVNTIPGLTPVSLFPKAAKAAGISYPVLLDKIIAFALEK